MDQFSNHPLYKRHNIDTAMSSLWDFYKKRFLSLFIISFSMSLVIQYLSTFMNLQDLSTVTDPMVMLEMMKEMMFPILIISVANLLFNVVLQYYVIYNPLDKENNIFVSFIRSLRYFIPYLIVMILLVFAGSIAIVLGIIGSGGRGFLLNYIHNEPLFVHPANHDDGGAKYR